MTMDEIRKLIALGTGETLEFDHSKTFVDLFAEQVSRNPNNIAVVDKDSQLNYKELDEQSNAIAHWLIEEYKVQSNDFVAVMLPRRKEFVTAVIGIWKAGAAYVPIDPEYPEVRRRFMFEDCGAKVLISKESWPLAEAVTEERKRPVNFSTSDGLAYMVYTSGSTGTPKGAMVGHEGLVNYSLSNIGINGLTSSDRIAAHSSFSFSAHIADFYPTLIAGASVYVMSEDIRKDAELINGYFASHSITGCYLTSSLAVLVYNSYDLHLRYLGATGEKVSGIASGRNGVQIINGYGFSEGTDLSSTFLLASGVEYDNIPIGRPLPNCTVFLLDNELKLVPRGVVGELFFVGCQVGKGYWRQPELTAEKFVDCPYLPGQKMYRTGDLVRWNEDGQLEYIGRIDNQIKLRGYRIEPGEIESAAAKIDGVSQAVAVVKKDTLRLYYTGEATGITIQTQLAKTLTDYMVPGAYVHLDVMPLTPNGKIDRKALPEPEMYDAEIVLPETAKEQEVYDIVVGALELEQFGVTNNLISLGMTSIAAMRLAMRLQNTFGTGIRMTDLMEHPTVREVTGQIETASADDSRSSYGTIHPVQGYYPLTANQLGVYIDWEGHKRGLQYNMPCALKIQHIDVNRFSQAIKQVVNAKPILKMHLAIVQGEVVQQRCDADEATVAVSVLPAEAQRDGESLKAFFHSRVRPFDLFEDALYRFELYIDGDTTYLFQDIHHIVTDGLSEAGLIKEIFAAYEGKEIQTERYTFYDYALETRSTDEDEQYFKSLIGDTEATVYPGSIDAQGQGKSRTVDIVIEKRLIEQARSKQGVTASTYILHSLMQVLKSFTREGRVLIATINNGRSHSCMQQCQGFFVNTLPILSEETSADLQRQFINSIRHEAYPLAKIVESAGIHPEILYVYEGEIFGETVNIKDFEPIALGLDTPKMPITLLVNPDNDEKYVVTVEYDDSRYTEADMLTLLNSVKIMATEGRLISKAEEQKLIALGTGETLEFDHSKTFVDLFAEQASRNPNNIAVVDKDSQLNYKELDEQSNAIAHWLIEEHKVQSNDFVAVMLPRRKEFVTAVIGIWKAGAAYVPIDPEYPEGRKQFMLADCEAKMVITGESLHEMPLTDTQYAPVNRATPHGLAYMIYTSGSTGEPKGVMITHASLNAFIVWETDLIHLKPGDNVAEYAGFSFDASISDLYPSLANGATLHILSSELRQDVSGMIDYFNRCRIRGLGMIPQMAVEILNGHNTSLDYMMMGGDKAIPCHRSGIPVYNVYGPTEFTNTATVFPIDRDFAGLTIPIGRPVTNSVSMIMDDFGRLVPYGMKGELCLAGVQIAKGYWHRPELTGKKFVDCPYLPGQKMYRTGDLVRWNEDGQLEYIGRIDNQIKLRGFRIELGEVENAATKIDGVSQTAAVVKKDTLYLYYTGEANEADIEARLAETLADYMVPGAYMHLDAMPLTPNGKIDRKALPESDISSICEYVAPANDTEAMICKVFSDILCLTRVSATDDFLYLGGDSIKAIRVCSSLRNSQAVTESFRFSPNDIMRLRTPQLIAEFLANAVPLCTLGSAFTREGDVHSRELFDTILESRLAIVPKAYATPLSEYDRRGLDVNKAQTIPLKLLISKKVTLDFALKQFSQAVSDTVFEYAYDSESLIHYPGQWNNIPVYDMTEEEADSILQALYCHPYVYDGKTMLSVVYAISPEDSTNHLIYFDIHHGIFDFASSEILVSRINRLLEGKSVIDDGDASSQEAVMMQAAPQALNEYKEAVARITNILKDYDCQSCAFAVRADNNDNPLVVMVECFLENNRILDSEQTIPVLVTRHGRDVSNFNQMGLFVKTSAELYDRTTGVFRRIDDVEHLGEMENEAFIPLLNFQGFFEDERSREEQLAILKGKEKDKRITGSAVGDELIIKLPVYK